MDEGGTMHYATPEVVGVFSTASALETAVEQLEIAGVDRAAISVTWYERAAARSVGRPLSLGQGDRGRPVGAARRLRIARFANRG